MSRNPSMSAQEHMARPEYQERLQRDIALTERIKAGYTPAEKTEEDTRPRIVDGMLDEDAQEALGQLFLHYERLAIKEARQFSAKSHNRTSLETEDLVNQSYFGVYHAAVTFDPDQGTSFTSHARRTIMSHVSKYAMEHDSLVRLPVNVRGEVRRFGKTIWSVYQSNGRNGGRFPRTSQVAEHMGIDEEETKALEMLEAITTQMGSINEGYFADGRDRHTILEAGEGKWRAVYDIANIATREVDMEVVNRVMGEVVKEVLLEYEDQGEVSKLGALVLRLRVAGTKQNDWQPMLYQEVAQALTEIDGVKRTRERVRQIENKTLAILRNPKYRIKLYLTDDAA